VALQVDEDFRTHAEVWNKFIRLSFWCGGAIVVALAILAAAIF
jgi:hypothetical protein